MNIHPQIISKNDSPEFVVLPYKEYQNLLVTLEEQEDIKEIEEFHSTKQYTIPFKLLRAIATGTNPVQVFRKFRGLSQAKLAKETGISRQYLCQIENKQRKGNISVLKKIAIILNVDLDLLIN
ncbi:MAG: hypothetical protein AMJ43_05535 [Coxiella sp. DG_40]|nr:MAG: hypothetical protein AMJ43_05535 [Coxiella sp. DG_40]